MPCRIILITPPCFIDDDAMLQDVMSQTNIKGIDFVWREEMEMKNNYNLVMLHMVPKLTEKSNNNA